MRATTGIRFFVAIGCVTLVLGALGRSPSPPPLTVAQDDTTARRECPLPVTIKTGGQTVTTISVAGPITNVPEFHDCQRFIVDSLGKLVYDSLYAIFASFVLDTLWSDDEGLPESTAFAAAEIVSWGGTYRSLGIRPWFNCLLVFGTPGTPRAKMVSLGATNADCLNYAGGGVETPLDIRTVSTGFPETDIPAVARWEWDSVAKKQYIGIKCGRAWCHVYQRGANLTAEKAYGGARVSAVKGWYDEQILAVGTGTVSTIRGTIFPHQKLDSYTLNSFRKWSWMFRRPWLPAAYVALPGGAQPDFANYFGKMGFERAAVVTPPNLGLLNQIWLCNGSRFQCRIPANLLCTWPTSGVPNDSLWWAKMQSPAGLVRFKCVKRHDHSDLTEAGIHIPGTARWRWLADDETEWMRCAQGCCEPH